jgi:pyruvate dehydrogenase E2 component (dihydrolipoamide acetyltransferase)
VTTEAEGVRRPLGRVRRAVGAAMTASAQIPQFTLEATARLGRAAAWRRDASAGDARPSWSDLLTAASARALVAHPYVNASVDGRDLVEHAAVNVGLAVAIDDGLVVPAILGADRLAVADLARERRRLTTAARAGELRPAELYGATFSISNLGPYGIERFRALVIPPQAAILAVGRLDDRGAEPTMALSLSCDHRVLDGAPAAVFLRDLVGFLEEPAWTEGLARG